jgi:hypothetical protein
VLQALELPRPAGLQPVLPRPRRWPVEAQTILMQASNLPTLAR